MITTETKAKVMSPYIGQPLKCKYPFHAKGNSLDKDGKLILSASIIAAAVVGKVDSLQHQINRTNNRLDTLTAYLRIYEIKNAYENRIIQNRFEDIERRMNEFIRPSEPSIENKKQRR